MAGVLINNILLPPLTELVIRRKVGDNELINTTPNDKQGYHYN
jgi:hypothetical protein